MKYVVSMEHGALILPYPPPPHSSNGIHIQEIIDIFTWKNFMKVQSRDRSWPHWLILARNKNLDLPTWKVIWVWLFTQSTMRLLKHLVLLTALILTGNLARMNGTWRGTFRLLRLTHLFRLHTHFRHLICTYFQKMKKRLKEKVFNLEYDFNKKCVSELKWWAQ